MTEITEENLKLIEGLCDAVSDLQDSEVIIHQEFHHLMGRIAAIAKPLGMQIIYEEKFNIYMISKYVDKPTTHEEDKRESKA